MHRLVLLQDYKLAIFSKIVLTIVYIISSIGLVAQDQEKLLIDDFSGTVEITNNGIAILPIFTVGKPASIVSLKLKKHKLSFEPQIRFILEGKPWSMHFWLRYQAIESKKFRLRLGIHPALNWRSISVVTNNMERQLLESRRYAASEIAPSLRLSDKITWQGYYFYVKGFDDGLKNGQLILTSIKFSQLRLTENLYTTLQPQLYFINLDSVQGLYTGGNISLGIKELPINLIISLNQKIISDVPTEDFFWNLTLKYSFK